MGEKKPIRMDIPRSEKDIDKISQEIHGEEEREEYVEEEAPVDTASLLAEAVHALSHLDSHISEIATVIRNLDSRLQSIERLLGVLARVLLLPEVKKQELREMLVKEIVDNLEA
ncbi:MAG: hypothetical protein RMH84_00035 [Sulfolobales archaeon]|nr:hypothetical protein [Sulfolobales archaeon]MDW8009976.1 hypothetical protein [Sulfolobales archaeon]